LQGFIAYSGDKLMPRKGNIPRREVLPDPLYNSTLVSKFINCVMWDGKKSTAEQLFYDALKIIQQKTGDDPLKVFKKAIDNVKPVLEVKTRRVGGANYQVPVEVNQNRRISLSIRWLITYSRARKEKSMEERLAAEFLDAANSRGAALKKREDVHKMAEANKAFAHYRW
jgi:small subunit ribosomal protein S7